MERIELETVFEFLRKNGLSECELALTEDVIEQRTTKSKSSSCFEVSSDDEFLSLASSTDFTKLSGIYFTTRPVSQSSSDRLSQFGTAIEEYSDHDMQWCEDEEIDCDLTEDKCIMSEQNREEPFEEQTTCSISSPEEEEDTNDFAGKWDLVSEDNEPFCVGNGLKVIHVEIDPEETELCCNNKDITPSTNLLGEEECCNEDCVVTDEEFMMNESSKDDYEIFELRIIQRKNRTGFEESKEFPIVLHSTIANQYYVTEFLGSSAFSRVVRAHDINSGINVCLKIIKNDKDALDQSLDEIKLLKLANRHDPSDERHILRLYDYFYHQEHLFIVTELLRENVYEFQRYNRDSSADPYFTLQRLQVIARQCLEALSYLHDLGIVHCDIKPENILIKNYERCQVKIIDLGSSCFLAGDENLSLYVQSRSYRAPEVMLGLPYDSKIDLWSLGSVLVELCSGEVLFPNEPVALMLARMSALLGPFDTEMLEEGQETHKYFTKEYDLYHLNEDTGELEYIVLDEEEEETTLEQHLLQVADDSMFIDFLRQLLEINPKRRPTAREALQHAWLSHSYYEEA